MFIGVAAPVEIIRLEKCLYVIGIGGSLLNKLRYLGRRITGKGCAKTAPGQALPMSTDASECQYFLSGISLSCPPAPKNGLAGRLLRNCLRKT